MKISNLTDLHSHKTLTVRLLTPHAHQVIQELERGLIEKNFILISQEGIFTLYMEEEKEKTKCPKNP